MPPNQARSNIHAANPQEAPAQHSRRCPQASRGHRPPHEANPADYHVNTLVLGSGVVHHTHETWLIRHITFCGKCGAWATTAPRLLTKECAKEPGRRAYELKRLTAGKEPNRRTAWPKRYAAYPSTHEPWGGARARLSVSCCAPRTTSDCASAVEWNKLGQAIEVRRWRVVRNAALDTYGCVIAVWSAIFARRKLEFLRCQICAHCDLWYPSCDSVILGGLSTKKWRVG